MRLVFCFAICCFTFGVKLSLCTPLANFQEEVDTVTPGQGPGPRINFMEVIKKILQSLFQRNGEDGQRRGFFNTVFGENSDFGQMISAFIQQMQQFFSNVSQMWRDNVNRQMTNWRRVLNNGNTANGGDFEVFRGIVRDTNELQKETSTLVREGNSISSKVMSSKSENNPEVTEFRGRVDRIRNSIDNIAKQLGITITPEIQQRIDDKMNGIELMATDLQKRINNLWKGISWRISNRLNNSLSANVKETDDPISEINDEDIETVNRLQKEVEEVWSEGTKYFSNSPSSTERSVEVEQKPKTNRPSFRSFFSSLFQDRFTTGMNRARGTFNGFLNRFRNSTRRCIQSDPPKNDSIPNRTS